MISFSSVARRDDQRVVRLLQELDELGGATAPDAADRLADAALVDAQAAVHPVEAGAGLFGAFEECRDPFSGKRVVLLLDVAPVDCVCMRSLRAEGQGDSAFVGEDVRPAPPTTP
jgi:hypothetical protein